MYVKILYVLLYVLIVDAQVAHFTLYSVVHLLGIPQE